MEKEYRELHGKIGQEKVIFSKEHHTFFDIGQWKDTVDLFEKSYPRLLKKVLAGATPCVRTWVWEFGYSRQGYPALYRTKEVITVESTGEVCQF